MTNLEFFLKCRPLLKVHPKCCSCKPIHQIRSMEVGLHEVKPDPQTIVPGLLEVSSSDRNNSNSKHHHHHLHNHHSSSAYNPSKPRNPSSNLPTHKISTIQGLNSTPVRITSLSGEQLQTMAKSSGLSVVHVTVPQVSIPNFAVSHSIPHDYIVATSATLIFFLIFYVSANNPCSCM